MQKAKATAQMYGAPDHQLPRFAVNGGNAFGGSTLRVGAATNICDQHSPLRSNEFDPTGRGCDEHLRSKRRP